MPSNFLQTHKEKKEIMWKQFHIKDKTERYISW